MFYVCTLCAHCVHIKLNPLSGHVTLLFFTVNHDFLPISKFSKNRQKHLKNDQTRIWQFLHWFLILPLCRMSICVHNCTHRKTQKINEFFKKLVKFQKAVQKWIGRLRCQIDQKSVFFGRDQKFNLVTYPGNQKIKIRKTRNSNLLKTSKLQKLLVFYLLDYWVCQNTKTSKLIL